MYFETKEDVAEAREIVQRGAKAKFLEQVQAYKALDVAARQGKPWEAEVQVRGGELRGRQCPLRRRLRRNAGYGSRPHAG